MISDTIVYKFNIIKLVVLVALLTFDKYIYKHVAQFWGPIHHNDMI